MPSELHLSERHRDELERSAISPEQIAQRGYRTVDQNAELKELGFTKSQFHAPGLLVPIRGVLGELRTFQFKPDRPRLHAKTGKAIKYETPYGSSNSLDVPTVAVASLDDPTVPLWLTEGAKKVDCASSQGLTCVGLTGVWNWKSKNSHGSSIVLPDFESVALRGRLVYIAFDSDAATNEQVQLAELRLHGWLKSQGAHALIVRIPGIPGRKVGLDDYFAAGGKIEELLDTVLTEPVRSQVGSDQASVLTQLLLSQDIELWHGPDLRPYATIRTTQSIVNLPIEGTRFAQQCAKLFWENRQKAAPRDSIQAAIGTLAAMAVHEGELFQPGNRIGWQDGSVYLALYDAAGSVVECGPSGWKVTTDSAIRFVRPPHAGELPLPVGGGTFEGFRRFANVIDQDWPLIEAFLVGCFLPKGTFPVLVGTGEQGSGKSMAFKLMRCLIDPVSSPLRFAPREEKALMAALASGYMLAFDNLSHLSDEQSDAFCRISSGAGLAARTLYTNAEETVIEARRPIMLNGIGDVVTRPDLADRSLLMRFSPLGGRGVDEAQLETEYATLRPYLLGAILDGVCRGISDWSATRSAQVRLRDFSKWSLAAARSDNRPVLFAALESNRREMQSSAVENDAFATTLMEWIDENGESTETAGSLLEALTNDWPDGKRFPVDWPKTAKAVANRLERISPLLRNMGYEVDRLGRTGRCRPWSFRKSSMIETTSSRSSLASPNSSSEAPVLELLRDDRSDESHTDKSKATSPRSTLRSVQGDACDGSDDDDTVEEISL